MFDAEADNNNRYIYRLCPQYILTLLRTAYCHQQEPLREAIRKHLTREASVCVHVPVRIDCFTTFQLEFHMPFLTLREWVDSERSHVEASVNTWPELGSLHIDCHEHARTCRHVIREANVSVVVCGWDNSKWTCWAFSNTHDDPTARDDDVAEEFGILPEDYIAADGSGPADGKIIDMENPIWCARSYWVKVVAIRMRVVVKEWTWLVRSTDADVKAWVSIPDLVT